MADNDTPRRVSLGFVIGIKKKPFKDPRPTQPPPLPNVPKTTLWTPGAMIEWAASDGRRGKLTSKHKPRLIAALDEATRAKESNQTSAAAKPKKNVRFEKDGDAEKTADVSSTVHAKADGEVDYKKNVDNPLGFTEEQDKALMRMKTTNPKGPWDDITKEVGRDKSDCTSRFKQIVPDDFWQKQENTGSQGGKQGNQDQEKQSREKQDKGKRDKSQKDDKKETEPQNSTDGWNLGEGLWGLTDGDNEGQSGENENKDTGCDRGGNGDAGKDDGWDSTKTNDSGWGNSQSNDDCWGNTKNDDCWGNTKNDDGWGNTKNDDSGWNDAQANNDGWGAPPEKKEDNLADTRNDDGWGEMANKANGGNNDALNEDVLPSANDVTWESKDTDGTNENTPGDDGWGTAVSKQTDLANDALAGSGAKTSSKKVSSKSGSKSHEKHRSRSSKKSDHSHKRSDDKHVEDGWPTDNGGAGDNNTSGDGGWPKENGDFGDNDANDNDGWPKEYGGTGDNNENGDDGWPKDNGGSGNDNVKSSDGWPKDNGGSGDEKKRDKDNNNHPTVYKVSPDKTFS